ncbi:MAG: glycogen synthase, partial [Gammaproteobacteria bacterium]|nr:glycogen synthase [Gammaproteobacteria bacterium]
PCVVHGVGGLKDTVEHLRNGFVFGGNSPREQADNFAAMVADALAMKTGSETRWQAISKAAAAARFSWSDAAAAYERDLYAGTDA